MLEGIAARGVLVRRRLNDGAIAGIVVGVCVGVGLAILCLYPVVVHLLKRRRRRRDPNVFEPETAEVSSGPSGADGAGNGHRRLSSQDSFKPEEIARGGIGGGSVKDVPWAPGGGFAYAQAQRQSTGEFTSPTETTAPIPYTQPLPPQPDLQNAPFPDYSGEFMPQAIGDVHTGILNGSSFDYYCPAVPSEAFGMVTTAEPPPEPMRSMSRGSSLRYNVRSLFSRKSTRDQSLGSPTSPTHREGQEAAAAAVQPGDAPLQRITTAPRTESPVQMGAMLPPPLPRTLGSPVQLASHPTPATVRSPESPPSEPHFTLSSSPPPLFPAPGTVNPMDIMPATTDSELYHRTEQELYKAYHSSPPAPQQLDREDSADAPSPFTLPPSTQITPVVQSPTPTQNEAPFKTEAVEEDVPMTDIPSHNHLSPLPEQDVRHPSYPSDSSTPLPGPASTNPSAQNTPATQLDTPSPKSEGTSDYRHSASPNTAVSNLSPRAGAYRCDEPGCNQVFDQPHKLKHHQRYHTKDHKCPYPGCGKGFGTKTHLQRHINDRHEKKKKFHCSVPGCDYSKQGGKGFPRKDNWKRHMIKIHNKEQHELPEPIEADLDMTGVWVQPGMQ